MFKGNGTYLSGLGLLLIVIVGAILHTKGLIPLEVAGALYVSILPLAIMALRRALEDAKNQISGENDRISAENKCLDEKLKQIKEALNVGSPGPEGDQGRKESGNEEV
ncbi:MAG: hypothetical protein ACREOP_01565 [Thermodesulfobacteriota bacterium]